MCAGDLAQRGRLLTVQQVLVIAQILVIVGCRQCWHGAPGEVGVDLLTVVEPGAARAQRLGKPFGLLRLGG